MKIKLQKPECRFLLILCSWASLVHSDSTPDPQVVPPPLARLAVTWQTGPTDDYVVTGFPGCALAGQQLWCVFPDSTRQRVGTVTEDGSFRFGVVYAKGSAGFAVHTADEDGRLSAPFHPRLDYPMMGGLGRAPNDRGFFNIIPASMDEEEHARPWLELARRLDPASGEPPAEGHPTYNVREMSFHEYSGLAPQNLTLYGYAPVGDTVTCIASVTGQSFSAPIGAADRRFSLVIPHQAVKPSRGRRGDHSTFVVTVSDRHNRLHSVSGFSPGLRW